MMVNYQPQPAKITNIIILAGCYLDIIMIDMPNTHLYTYLFKFFIVIVQLPVEATT